ncbi:YfgJ family double zinc ribbon protein [Vibrio salinus]|nr:zinc-ribbon domain-containing protein [Vibrio salinus]
MSFWASCSLKKVAACGSASYFCPQCNELKSKLHVFGFIWKEFKLLWM